MRSRWLAPLGALAIVTAFVSVAAVQLAGQAPTKANTTPAKNYTAPRTADGQPDLQGIWSYATITPLERPKELAGKEVLTEQEAADFARAYNQFWWDYGTKVIGTKRTSLIVDPPDGRLPALSGVASRRQQDRG